MDNADNAYVDGVGPAQCFACGQLFCGQCKPQLAANVTNCPNCRAPFNVPAEKNVARLLEVVKRTPGRHTPCAQNNLGAMYADGEGVRQDFTEAVKWWRLAADQGHAGAQYNLGLMYEKGQGVRQDYAEALKWYRLAADQGDAGAQSNLGLMYDQGKGVQQDYVEAVKWYMLAADQGDARAQFNLGAMYEKGEGVPQDYVEAVKWYRLGADQGYAIAQHNLGVRYATGTGVPQDFTKAARLFKLAVEQGFAHAITNLGMALHQHLFPSGTKVKLVGLKAAALNGKRGVVVARSGAAAPATGRIAVELEGGGGTKAIPYEKLERI
jgi:TPR repeat protein